MNEKIEMLARFIVKSSCNVALTGAGISTPSGIRDFRGPDGLWKIADPEKFEINYFNKYPDEVWELFNRHFMFENKISPNAAHIALAELEKLGMLCAVITQNIDGLHQNAGSGNVIELHGSLKNAVCTVCKKKYDLRELAGRYSHVPKCESCGGILKPDIVFFGEPLDDKVLEKATEYSSRAEIMLIIGSSLSVSPANYLPLYAKRNGAKIAIINDAPGEEDHMADIIIRERVETVLPELLNRIKMLADLYRHQHKNH